MDLPVGVYRIYKWGSQERPEVLSIIDGNVSVAPPSVNPSKNQEWFVEVSEDGVVIQHPPLIWPSRSLSYKEPEEGNRIILGPVADFPTRKWRVQLAPQRPFPIPFFISVIDKDLIIVQSPIFIEPPQLILGPNKNDLKDAWVFEFLRPL